MQFGHGTVPPAEAGFSIKDGGELVQAVLRERERVTVILGGRDVAGVVESDVSGSEERHDFKSK